MRLRLIPASICFLALCLPAAGQEADVCRDFSFRTATDPVFFISNPASISAFKGHFSMAGAGFRKENGGLASLTESPDSFMADAVTESYISISDRISFHGKLSWSYFAGEQMGAQILMDPAFNPFSFLESSETTTGRKNKESYSLLGAMSYRFSDRWSAGVSFDYVSADQTKVKDPRFSNIWMDMGITAGAAFRPGEDLMLGLTLRYRSTLEQVLGGVYGTTDQQYFYYTDKGGFLGTMSEVAGDYGYISVSGFRPMKNDFFALGFQAVSKGMTNELEVAYRTGYWGKKASSSATFFEFSGIEASYRGRMLRGSEASLHKISVDLGYKLIGNDENVFRYVTPVGQSMRVEYTGQNHILDRHTVSAELGYTWYKGTGGYLPEFSAGAALHGGMVMGSTVLYPYYRNFDTETLCARAYARKSFFSGRTIFTAGLDASYRMGFGTPAEDGSYASTTSSGLKSFDNYLHRQFEYDTAPAAGAGVSFACSFLVSAHFVPYIKLSDDFSALLQAPEYLQGRVRNVALITLGCSF